MLLNTTGLSTRFFQSSSVIAVQIAKIERLIQNVLMAGRFYFVKLFPFRLRKGYDAELSVRKIVQKSVLALFQKLLKAKALSLTWPYLMK